MNQWNLSKGGDREKVTGLGSAIFLFFFFLSPCAYAELPIRVAIIDSGLDSGYISKLNLCAYKPQQDFTGIGLADGIGHGTNVAGLVAKTAKSFGVPKRAYCIASYKVYDKQVVGQVELMRLPGTVLIDHLTAGINAAVADGAQIINISMSGKGSSKAEFLALGKALLAGIKIVVAAGNDGLDLTNNCIIYPACYTPSFLVVGNGTGPKAHKNLSNFGTPIDIWLPGCDTKSVNGTMCGTSMSTGIATGAIVAVKWRKLGGK